MTKDQALQEQQKVETQFDELNIKIQENQTELVKLQGEYRVLQRIIDEESVDKTKPEEAISE